MSRKGPANYRKNPWGYQVCIRRNGVEHQPFFSRNAYGSDEKAREAAEARAKELREELGPPSWPLREAPQKNKETTGVPAVSRTSIYDPRRDAFYLRYSVAWYDEGGRHRQKTFSFGRYGNSDGLADDELHAFRTAAFFRFVYVACIEHGIKFEPEWFDGWKERRIYDDFRLRLGERVHEEATGETGQ